MDMAEAYRLLEQATDTNARCMRALLHGQGFIWEKDSPRILQGEFVTLAVNTKGYRITFPSDGEPGGMAVLDLPMTATYGTVEAIASGIEGQLRRLAPPVRWGEAR